VQSRRLTAAHHKGIMHRNLERENLFVIRDGAVEDAPRRLSARRS
jgi:hypothetical protein